MTPQPLRLFPRLREKVLTAAREILSFLARHCTVNRNSTGERLDDTGSTKSYQNLSPGQTAQSLILAGQGWYENASHLSKLWLLRRSALAARRARWLGWLLMTVLMAGVMHGRHGSHACHIRSSPSHVDIGMSHAAHDRHHVPTDVAIPDLFLAGLPLDVRFSRQAGSEHAHPPHRNL